ncbi:MAG: Smr/MutS family protein [Chitinophagales bacterium]|nr:Smr/MutS family protein [Chitinophagales bacterium]
MKYEVGDDIIVLHSNEEGKVVEIINEKMVMIEVRGVKFPAYMDQIDFPYFKRFTEKKLFVPKKAPKVYVDQVPKEKGQPNSIKVADGVWLSLIPKFALDDFNDEVVELFKIHLVNRTEKALKFQYTQSFLGDPAFELSSEVLSFHDFYLHDISFGDFSDNPVFRFIFEMVTPEKGKAKWFETETRIKAKQLFKRIEEMKEANEPMLSYSLFKDFPAEQVEEKFELTGLAAKGFKVYEAKEARKHLPPARSVIDLHMEKLMDNWQTLSNVEILGIQLAEFEKYYELAIAHHQPSLIVIHGVGTGRLRDEIHDLLKGRKEVRYFVNQYDARFGYGATEIFFQY